MASHAHKVTNEVMQRRKRGGVWLKKLRQDAGLTQRELAERAGLQYYTFISQIESGKGRVPPEQYDQFAQALGWETPDFVKELLKYYDPLTYKALFDTPRRGRGR